MSDEDLKESRRRATRALVALAEALVERARDVDEANAVLLELEHPEGRPLLIAPPCAYAGLLAKLAHFALAVNLVGTFRQMGSDVVQETARTCFPPAVAQDLIRCASEQAWGERRAEVERLARVLESVGYKVTDVCVDPSAQPEAKDPGLN